MATNSNTAKSFEPLLSTGRDWIDQLKEKASSISNHYNSVDIPSRSSSHDTSTWIRQLKDRATGVTTTSTTNTSSSLQNKQASHDSSTNDHDESLCSELNYTERMVGFGTCMVGGSILSFGSFIKFLKLLTGNPIPFVLTWTMGNLVSLGGSCFLVGPTRQIQAMLHKTRVVATTVYLTSMLLTVVVVVLAQVKAQAEGTTPALLSVVLLILMVLQFGAVLWYGVSYVPFGRELILRYVCRDDDATRAQYRQILP